MYNEIFVQLIYRGGLSERNVEEAHVFPNTYREGIELVLEETDAVRAQSTVEDLNGQLKDTIEIRGLLVHELIDGNLPSLPPKQLRLRR